MQRKTIKMQKHLGHMFSLILMTLSVMSCSISPPVQEMSDARQAITAAEVVDASEHAPMQMGNARRFLEEAEAHIKQQQYGLARSMARIAKNSAVEALEVSQATGNSAEEN